MRKKLPVLSESQIAAADTLGVGHEQLKVMISKPLYAFTPAEIDLYLPYLQYTIPGLQERVKHLARKNLGQPYEIYLLGEYPVEIYDRQPLYCLEKSDCVVFCEHTLAMALAHDWQSLFAVLQRIRYRDGIIGYTTRNHYGEYDWPRNNTWLAENITGDLAGDRLAYDTVKVDKGNFFRKRGVPYSLPEDSLVWSYVPLGIMPEILDQLETGDIVNVVRGYKDNKWVGHYGFVMTDEDEVYFLHSTPPEVIQQPFREVIDAAAASNLEKQEKNAEIEINNKAIKAYNESHEKRSPLRIPPPIRLDTVFCAWKTIRWET
ncbi:MAG: DUF1460 domain-containing protein [Candidatus Marinimicrobia bacterium]|nr:DUF1460 domain-containing protein [Candidatus Neomarinimicrobiota bacterium]